MLNVSIRESTMVKPTRETPKHTQWISNLDLLVPRIHIPTVSFYKPNGSPMFFNPSLLKEALGNVLVPFYPLAGRLNFNDISGRLEINCNGEGVLFVEAESDHVVDFLGDFNPSSQQLQPLVPSFDYSAADISSYPLAVFQVTYFKCGGVCLGSGLHHTIVDGSAAIHFINAWSEIVRGVPITIPPFLDRTLLCGRQQPTPMFDHIEYHLPSCTKEEPPLCPQITTNSTATMKVKPGQLHILKSKLQEMENGIPTKKISTYEAIATHVWHCASAARDLSDDQEMKLYMVVDARNKLDPPLPPGYFGNAIFTSTAVTTACELKLQPMWCTVQKIRNVLMRMQDDYLRSAIDYLELQADPMALVRGARTFGCPNLNVVSWLTLPLCADFGWGKPIHVGPAQVTFEGLAYILRDPTSDGGVSVVICLQAQHMKLFKKLFYDF